MSQKPGNHKSNDQIVICLDDKITVSGQCDSVHENKVVVKLSGVLAVNDSIPETGNDTGLDLVNGEVGGNVVSALRDTGILGYQPHISLYIV